MYVSVQVKDPYRKRYW